MKFKEVKKQKGFTMIELVIVIAVLGILAAFALPRFANFTSQANSATYQNINGIIYASLGVVKAKHIAGGSTGTTVDMNGFTVPVTSTGDINFTIAGATDASCVNLMNALLTNTNGLQFSKSPYINPSCYISKSSGNGFFILLDDTGTH